MRRAADSADRIVAWHGVCGSGAPAELPEAAQNREQGRGHTEYGDHVMSAATVPIHDLATWPHPVVRTRQLAEYLGLSRRTLDHHIEKGALPALRRGGIRVIRLADARAYAGESPTT